MCPTLFVDALNGKYNDETRWISREDFERLKDTDPYVAVVWSFGNNLRDYLYSREIEPLKKAIHYAMFFHDYSLGLELGHDLSFIEPINDLQKRYLAIKHYFEGKMNGRMQSFDGGSRICQIGNSRASWTLPNHQYKRPSELQHLECINRVQEFKKKNRQGELCNGERISRMSSLAVPRTASLISSKGGVFLTSHKLSA